MNLFVELRQWRDDNTGEVKEYYVYYVVVAGVKVYMQPKDNTGRQLLALAVKNKRGSE